MVTPPQLDSLDESPLVRLSGWALNHDQHLFDVEVTGTDAPPPVRLAVLNDYDGVTWRIGATYRNAGRVVAGKPVLTDPQVRQVFRIADLDGRLLPGIATPEEVNGVRVAVDTTDGTMILSDGLRPGLEYNVVSRAHRPDENAMQVAEVPNTDAVARHLPLPGKVPDSIAQWRGTSGRACRRHTRRRSRSPAGSPSTTRSSATPPAATPTPTSNTSCSGPNKPAGKGIRQFAAAFAVLARLMGLPTRLAVGFGRRRPQRGPRRRRRRMAGGAVQRRLGAVRPDAQGRHRPAPDRGRLPPETPRVAPPPGDRARAVGLGRVAVAEAHRGTDR